MSGYLIFGVKLLLSYIFLQSHYTAWGLQCPYIEEASRVRCFASSAKKCSEKGCCWDDNARYKCYKRECRPGTFGFGCRFNCTCSDRGVCDPITGQCPTECPSGKWGIGCMLDDDCTYNDQPGLSYLGRKAVTEHGKTCKPWKKQNAYTDDQFPDKDKRMANNYCRNPEPADFRTWCYTELGQTSSDREFESCSLASCLCPVGRWGVNCERECHCSDLNEYCDAKTGDCASSCARGWTGRYCQECPDLWFGVNCDLRCNCEDEFEACNKETGECSSGCFRGYAGEGCLIAVNPPVSIERHVRSVECHCLDDSDPCSPDCRSGCQPGWVGQSCHIEVPSITKAPIVLARSATSIQLKWNRWRKPPDRGDGPVNDFFVFFRAESDVEEKRQRVNIPRYTLNNLRNSTIYSVQIAPIHEQGFVGNRSPAVNISTCGVPSESVRNLEVSVVEEVKSSNQVTLKVEWEKLSANDMDHVGCERLDHYNVYTKGPGDDDFIFNDSVEISRSMIHGVNPYANFEVGVTLVNNAGFESEKAVKTIIGKSGPVRNMRVVPSSGSVVISWDSPEASNSEIVNYIVRHRRTAIADCDDKIQSWNPIIDLPGTQTTYILSDLQPYSRYVVKVWVRTEKHRKGQQMSSNVTTLASVPSAPVQGLMVKEISARHVSVSWEPPPCESRNGIFAGYYVRLVHKQEQVGNVVDERYVNETSLSLTKNLIPYENYTLSIQYKNHVGLGPEAKREFSMSQSHPPAPNNVHIASTTFNELVLAWESPEPAHGIITKYEVKYWASANPGSPSQVELGADDRQFTLDNLEPNESYLFRMRAFTVVGSGNWSVIVSGLTEESYPSAPEDLRNVSREEKSLTLAWNPPKIPNGVISLYKVRCQVSRALHRYPIDEFQREVPGEQLLATLGGLYAGSDYYCEVKARTSKGFGEATSGEFFTLPEKPTPPDMPGIKAEDVTDTTVKILLHPTTWTTPNVETTTIKNRVIVERLTMDVAKWYHRQRRSLPKSAEQFLSNDVVHDDVSKFQRRRSTANDKSPCGLTHSKLLNYSMATERGQPCYVTHESGRIYERKDFVIGDNTTDQFGYWNAPLIKGQQYRIWLELSVEVDGEIRSSFTSVSSPVQAAAYTGASSEKSVTGTASIVAGVVVAIITVSICVFIVIAFLIKKKRLSGGYQHAGRTESERISSSPKASSHHEKSSTADVYLQSTDSEAEGDESDPLYPKVVTPRPPISVEDLWNYVRHRKITDSTAFKQEYDELPMGLTAHCEAARKPENRNKNRYGNIIAYDHSRVKLDAVIDDPHSDYINANYIDAYRRPGMWIATQGPSKQTFTDMWRMVWQERAHRVIMVTNLIEDGRHKCDQYWPDSGSRTYGQITVEKLEEEQYADFTIRTFNMTKGEETRILRQFHFTSWPDHGCPIYATSLIAFRKKVRSYDDPTAGPSVVHCSAGVGRTGTFIALDYLLDMAKAEQQVDVFNTVNYMRGFRVNMVQTQEQYEFVYEALLEALKSGDTAIPCVDFRKRFNDLLKVNPDTNKVRIEEEFELLSMLSMNPPSQTGCKCATDTENVVKNRHRDIIPLDNMQRPFLMTYIPGSSDYINAVFTDGYKHRDAFIITQMPLPNTVTDFWAMIYDHECTAIVMMNELINNDPSCACYYPVQAGSQQHGPFTIETVVLDSTFPDITIRDVTLTINKKVSEPRSVRQFQFHGWPSDQKLPVRRSSVIQLLQLIEKWQQRSGNKTIVVHCMDGATRSGLLCAISYMIERLKVEQEVDVFNSVKHTRINRPQLIPSLEQYQYIYDMAEEYMDCFETYANFK